MLRRMPRAPLVALGFGCAVAVVLLYAGELGLRLAHRDPGLQAMAEARQAGRPFDARPRRQVVADLRAAGRDAVPRLVPAGPLAEGDDGALHSLLVHEGRELLPLGGISSRTTVLCSESGGWAIYESDEHGFRNPEGVWSLAPVDLVLLGDSFTIGECVAPGENVADRLRAEKPATVNLGYSGDSPLFELATLAEYGPILRPRTTLWMYFENDLSWFDLGRSRRAPLLLRYLEQGATQGLADLQPAIDARLGELLDSDVAQPDDAGPVNQLAALRPGLSESLGGFATLRSLRARLWSLRGTTRELREPPDYALFARILGRARELVSGWQGELVVVFLPGVWNFDPHSRGPAFADPAARRKVRAIAESLGLPFVDVQARLETHPDPLSLYAYRGDSLLGSPHMNAAGYALVAESIAGRLAELSARRSQISRQ